MNYPGRIIEDWLDMARKAALKAGTFLAGSNSDSYKVIFDSKRDIKINADRQSERILLDVLKKCSNFSILSEEAGLIRRSQKDFIWIIDPLDGSLNFLQGIPFSCVSIALWKNGHPLLGVIYDFWRKELFVASADRPAYLNQERIRVSKINNKSSAILCTGFPAKAEFSTASLCGTVSKIRDFKKVRMLGSAALSLAYVSCARADFYQEDDIRLWDVAAGLALIKSAGGNFRLKKGRLKDTLNVAASNRYLLPDD